MCDEYMIEASVCFECRNCRKQTNIPALKVVPGIKCSHCGAMLVVDAYAIAMKTVMLMAAASRNDVKVD